MTTANLRHAMVAQPVCIHSARWQGKIAPAYPNPTGGRHAPLLRAGLREDPPNGAICARKVLFTPTFILIEDGTERARIKGYPGQEFFGPLLALMQTDNTDCDPQAAADAADRTRQGG